jgi:hypothetical protein
MQTLTQLLENHLMTDIVQQQIKQFYITLQTAINSIKLPVQYAGRTLQKTTCHYYTVDSY